MGTTGVGPVRKPLNVMPLKPNPGTRPFYSGQAPSSRMGPQRNKRTPDTTRGGIRIARPTKIREVPSLRPNASTVWSHS